MHGQKNIEFPNVVLEKEGEDQITDRVGNEEVLDKESWKGGISYVKYKGERLTGLATTC